jgi:hypothetical protein
MQSDQTNTRTKKQGKAKKIAAILSTIIWLLAFALAFAIPPQSSFIWMPDAVLLAGFIPLLFIYSPSWPWLVFGVLNTIIGFFLLLSSYIPNNEFPNDIITVKKHIADYHAPFTWMYFGVVAILYGLIRLFKNTTLFLVKRNKNTNK